MNADKPTIRFPLRLKLSLAFSLGGLLPLLFLGLVTLRIQHSGLSASEKASEVAIIDLVGNVVERLEEDASEATHRVGSILGEGRIADDEARLTLARETLGRAAALAQVAVYAADGSLLDAINRSEGRVTPLPKAPLPAPKGRWLETEFAAGDPLLRYIEPIRPEDPGAPIRGYVIGTVAPQALAQQLLDLAERHFGQPNRQGRVVLLDGQMQVLFGVMEGSLQVGKSARGVDIFRSFEVRSDAPPQFGLSKEFTGEKGEAMVGTLRLLKNRMVVAVRRPQQEAFEALTSARLAFLFAICICALGMVIMGSYFAGRLVRPVKALQTLAAAYGRREFATRPEIHTGDELEGLSHSMSEMATELSKSEEELARREVVTANLSRYLPAELARAVAAGRHSLALGGERKEITALFADVVSFTNFAESAPPEKVVAFLNELFTVLTEVVFRHNGMVDKFIGDCVMAVFSAEGAKEDHALRALSAAEDMHRFVEATSSAWLDAYGVEIRLGIGVSSGEALLGNLGSESRMEYTAIGDVVNIAARLEAMAQPGQTLVTSQVKVLAEQAQGSFTFRSLGRHPLHGKKQDVEILEVL